MKYNFLLFFLIYIPFSCKKKNDIVQQYHLSLLQHTWMVISLNGEAFRYIGIPQDYIRYDNNGRLYKYISGIYDTSDYNLDETGSVLKENPIVNGFESITPTYYNLNLISTLQLILSSNPRPSIFILDSLKR